MGMVLMIMFSIIFLIILKRIMLFVFLCVIISISNLEILKVRVFFVLGMRLSRKFVLNWIFVLGMW